SAFLRRPLLGRLGLAWRFGRAALHPRAASSGGGPPYVLAAEAAVVRLRLRVRRFRRRRRHARLPAPVRLPHPPGARHAVGPPAAARLADLAPAARGPDTHGSAT